MPKLPPTPCTQPGCKAYATKRGRCEEHQRQGNWQWKNRPERMSGWKWTKLREKVLQRAGYLCEVCDSLKRATEVDHIVNLANGGTNDTNNLQAICFQCHARKTRLEAQRGRTQHSSR